MIFLLARLLHKITRKTQLFAGSTLADFREACGWEFIGDVRGPWRPWGFPFESWGYPQSSHFLGFYPKTNQLGVAPRWNFKLTCGAKPSPETAQVGANCTSRKWGHEVEKWERTIRSMSRKWNQSHYDSVNPRNQTWINPPFGGDIIPNVYLINLY